MTQYFPPGGALAALAGRTYSLAETTSGSIALAALVTGSGFAVLAYTPSTSGWSQLFPEASVSLFNPVSVIPGYTLDSYYGLMQWGDSAYTALGSPPFVAMTGDYVLTQSAIYTLSGTDLSLSSSISGIVSASASGSTIFAISAVSGYTIAVSGASGTVSSVEFPFTPTCVFASGSSSIVGGYENYTLSYPAATISVQSGAKTFVGIHGTTANVLTSSGSPAVWSLLQANTIDAVSDSVSSVWSNLGNIIAITDSASGKWFVYNYTGGVMSLNTSGAVTNTGPVAQNDAGTLLVFASVSGVGVLSQNGSSWVETSEFSGDFPSSSAVIAVSGSTFAVLSSGSLSLITYANSAWSSGSAVSLSFSPLVGAVNRDTLTAYVADTQNLAQINLSTASIVATGTWNETAATPVSMAIWGSDVAIFTASDINVAGPSYSILNYSAPPFYVYPSGSTLYTVGSGSAFDVPAGYSWTILGSGQILNPIVKIPLASSILCSSPFLFDMTMPLGNDTQIQLIVPDWRPVRNGVYTTFSGSTSGSLTSLGQSMVPSAIGLGVSGNLLIGLDNGYVKTVGGSLTSVLTSGGISAILAASGVTWMASTIAGGLVTAAL